MSYEGLDELVCATGHYHSYDNLGVAIWPEKCPTCNSKWSKHHVVNLTNGRTSETKFLKDRLEVLSEETQLVETVVSITYKQPLKRHGWGKTQ